MPATIYHAYTNTVADGTATSVVRPSDWNSAHQITLSPSGQEIIGAFSNAGNVTFGTNTAGYVTATAPAGGGAGDGGNVIAVAGSTNASTGTVLFSNANGVTFGLNAGTVTASHNGLTTAAQSNHSHNFATTTTTGASIVVGTTNSNGVTVGVPAYLTTAQPVGAYLTTARASTDAIGLNTALTANGLSVTANSSGLSINVPAWLITAAQSNHSHGNPTLALTNLSGTTASNSNGLTLSLSAAVGGGGDGYNIIGVNGGGTALSTTLQLSNANNVSFGLNAGTITASASYPTTYRASNDAIGLNTALTANGLSVTANSSGLSINVPAWLTTAAQSNHSHNFATTTTNGSQIVVGTTNSAGATIGVPPFITTYVAQTTQTQPAGNIAGVGTSATNASITLNSNGLAISVAAPGGGGAINVSAGTTSGNLQTIQFNNGNGVTFGLNGSTVTASVNAGGGAAPDRFFKEVIQGERLTTICGLSGTSVTNRPLFLPFYLEGTGLAANTARVLMSFGASSNRSLGGTFRCGLYSLANSTQMTLLTSNSWSVSSTASASSASWNGAGWVDFGLGGYTCTAEGRYMIALQVNPVSANVTWMPVSLYGADPMPVQSKVWYNGTTSTIATTSQFVPFWGAYTTTTNALPNSVGINQVNGVSSNSQYQYYCALREV